MLELNSHVLALKESATLKINQAMQKLRRQGKEVYHFGFGQSPFPIHPKMVQALKDNAHNHDYLPTLGLPALREQIAHYYKRVFNYDFDPDLMAIGPGSKELLFQALLILEGDVFIPAPSWVSYGPQVLCLGKSFVPIPTKMANNYKITPEELKSAAINSKTKQKILILNSPNNPSGAVYSDGEIESLVKVCKEHNIKVISDEIYSLVDFTGITKKGFFHYYPEGTFVTGGLSKTHSAGGWRFGFIATSSTQSEFIKAMATLISETFSAISAPIQFAALTAYSDDKEIEEYVQNCSIIHGKIGHYMAERFNQMAVKTPRPDGAFYIFPDFGQYKEKLKEKHNVSTSEDLCQLLLEKTGVGMLPGSDFYCPKEMLVARVATVDYNGEKVYQAFLKENIDGNFIKKHCPLIEKGLNSLESFLLAL